MIICPIRESHLDRRFKTMMDKLIALKLALIPVILIVDVLISVVLLDLIQGTWYQLRQ